MNKGVCDLLLKKLDLVLLLCGALIFAVSSEGRAHPGHEEDLETAAGSASGLPAPQVSITEENGYRVIKANGVPNHEIGQFPGPGCPRYRKSSRKPFFSIFCTQIKDKYLI